MDETKEDLKEFKYIDNAKNFEPVKSSVGSLLKAKNKLFHLMKIPEQEFFDLEKDEVVLVLHDFINKNTGERVFIFLYNESKYMFISDDVVKDFLKIHNGSCEQKYNNE